MQLPGTVALVTGGSSGIGAATVRALAAAGARPLIAGRDPARLEAMARETGGLALAADLAAADGPAELAEAALQAAGPGGIDLLVNNAGIGWAGPIEQMTGQQAARLIAVNLAAPVELTRLLVPGMIARGRGHIVFVSSIAGATGVRGEAVYSAVKAGLGCFAESLAHELAGRGVRVSVIVLGVIDTPFFERRGRPYDRRRPTPLPANRVANALVSAIERNQYMVFVPRWMGFPAWLHGAAPGVFRHLADRFG
ncbi:MAG TPA: SDR family NAD(P)-dependent oxidoreductase [Streptosporangiaceae bacterium]|nr:SDR family NAD(P)-dependent oxidoreductase [Streptosporangiaceae bacterium]